jgi:hypothetical protein
MGVPRRQLVDPFLDDIYRGSHQPKLLVEVVHGALLANAPGATRLEAPIHVSKTDGSRTMRGKDLEYRGRGMPCRIGSMLGMDVSPGAKHAPAIAVDTSRVTRTHLRRVDCAY